MTKTFLLSTALIGLLALPAAAFDMNAMTDAERTQFRAEIRSYLMENPEVLLEAINVLEERQAAEAAKGDVELVAANSDAIFNDGHSWVGGNPDGDVTIVEFMDYRCSYCKRAFPEVDELLKTDGNIRFIVKELPILGEQSELAARFAIAVKTVAGDEAYGKAHDILMNLRADITEESLSDLSEQLGFDTPKVFAEMNSDAVRDTILENRMLAQRLNINGTPSFIFEDQMVRGYVPLNGMQDIVASVRAD